VLGIAVERGMVIRDMEVMLAVSLQILGVPIYYQRKFIHACKKTGGKSYPTALCTVYTRAQSAICFTRVWRAEHHIVLLDTSNKDNKDPSNVDKLCTDATPARPQRRTVGASCSMPAHTHMWGVSLTSML